LEARESNRLTHGDYVSEDIKMDFSRDGVRGLFSMRRIPAGTLMIAEKALFSVFPSDLPHLTSEYQPKSKMTDDPTVLKLVGKAVDGMWRNHLGGRMTGLEADLRLEVSSESGVTYQRFPAGVVSLQWDFQEKPSPHETLLNITPLAQGIVENVVRLNGYKIEGFYLPVLLGGLQNFRDSLTSPNSHGLFYTTSFMNHSCVPNCDRFFIGDFIFVVTSVDIPASTELTMAYWSPIFPLARRDAQADDYRFKCTCPLCEHQRRDSQKLETAELLLNELQAEDVVEYERAGAVLKSIRKMFGFEMKLSHGLACPPLKGAVRSHVLGNASPLNIASYLTSTLELYDALFKPYARAEFWEAAAVIRADLCLTYFEAQPIMTPIQVVFSMLEVWELCVRGGVSREKSETWLREAKVLLKSVYLQCDEAWEILVGSFVTKYYGNA